MNPFFANMPLGDLLQELRVVMQESGVPPLDLVVALMGYCIDVQALMDEMQLEVEAE